jgi:hypothetical protein
VKASRRLERGYEHLDAPERFRLLVAAEACADDAEVERLLRSCSRRAFQLPDPAFTDRVDGAYEVTIAVVSELYAIGGRLAAIDAVDQMARILFAAAADEAEFVAFRITNATQPAVRRAVRRERGRLRKFVRHLRRALLNDGATVAHAFAVVCRDELEVDPEAMVAAAAAPFAGLFAYFFAQAPDTDAVDALRSELADRWRVGIGERQRNDVPEKGT